MKIKSEKGVTNIDITVSIILITLFVGIIAALMLNIHANSNAINKKAEATNYAINEIELVKAADFDTAETLAVEGNIGDTGYYKKITVTDYANLEENKNLNIIQGLVKKVTVEISYREGSEIKTVDISTLITNKR